MKETTPEKKSVKTLKGQLFGAVSMMLVAAIALGTSTYAWFINNRTVEVQNMQLTVSTSTSLLVAVGKKASVSAADTAYAPNDYTTFKTVVMNQDITGKDNSNVALPAGSDVADWGDFLTTEMKPSSVTSASLGTVASFPTFFMSLDKLTDGKVSDFEALKIGGSDTAKTDVGQGPVKAIRFAFQASSDLDVYFGRAASADGTVPAMTSVADMITSSDPNNTQDKIDGMPTSSQAEITAKAAAVKALAEAEAIKAALRVAIVPRNTAKITTATTPTVLQFDGGTKKFTNSVNNTYYKDVTTDTNTQLDGSKNPLNDEKLGEYAAAGAVGANKHLTTIGKLSAMVPAAAAAGNDPDKVIIAKVDSAGVVTTVASNVPMFKLMADENRVVDVYFWLEGTDQDCINALSAYKFNLTLPFAAVETGTPHTPPVSP